ncbi:flavoprotein [Bacillus suaedaesalsae]|uniref:Flavoprotein n=1 Tax=Bacillus suaedaesalsae TaxID=2810349 RepID=A0ABS2DM18_9BACI|nr:flavoprotein [Bacillus suaedaesalsae]MBM6619536.1 flavoprotein [Bacillus suaedaesalsae]
MDESFEKSLDRYLFAWKTSSLVDLQKYISEGYKAREVSQGEIIDFGFEQSIKGWKQGFHFAKENNANWILEQISIIPLRADEKMVIISASLEIQGKPLETANLFFQTFKKIDGSEWKLVRSYIEAGVLPPK